MKKQVFGAILLSAALAVGTAMPAFAAGSTDTVHSKGNVGSNSDYTISSVAGNGGQTTVNVSTVITQINVSVPLTVSFYAETGGGTLGVPDDGIYKLENHSANDVYIVNIATTSVDSNKWLTASGSANLETTQAVADVTYGKIKACMTGTYTNAKPIYFSNEGTGNKITTGDAKIPAAKNGTAGTVGFNFEGTNSVLNSSAAAAEQLTQITYTVSINSKFDVEA